jgi:hypothetical protein
MAVQKAMATGTAKVMDWFDRNASSPYYSVYEIISPTKKDLLFSSNDDSLDNARQILEENISAFEANGVNTLYALVLHPKKEKSGYITPNTPSHAMLKFRPSEETQIIGAVAPQREPSWQMMQLIEKLNSIESRLAAQEAIGDLEEDEEIEQPSPIMAMLNKPEVQDVLVSGLVGLMSGVFAPKPIAGIAGISEDGEIMAIVNSLMNKGVTIDHLRKLNEMGEMKLKSLLLML